LGGHGRNSHTQSSPRSIISSTLRCTKALRKLARSLVHHSHTSGCKQNSHQRKQTGIYTCTLGCGYQSKRHADLFRHEQTVYPQQFWFCFLCGDVHNPSEKHFFTRDDKIRKHIQSFHPGVITTRQCEVTGVRTLFPERCELCLHHRHKSWKHRSEHIIRHYQQGHVFPRTTGRHSGKQPVQSLGSGQDDGDDDDNDDDDMDDSDHTEPPEDDQPGHLDDPTNPGGPPGNQDSDGGPNGAGEDFFDMSQWVTPAFLSLTHTRTYRRNIHGHSQSDLAAFWQTVVKGILARWPERYNTDYIERLLTQTPRTYVQETGSHKERDECANNPPDQSRCGQTFGIADRECRTTRTILCETSNCSPRKSPTIGDTCLVKSQANYSFTHHRVLGYEEMSPLKHEQNDPGESPSNPYTSIDSVPTLRSNTVHCGPPDNSLMCSTPESRPIFSAGHDVDERAYKRAKGDARSVFVQGRVFAMLFTETAGDAMARNGTENTGITIERLGQHVISQICRRPWSATFFCCICSRQSVQGRIGKKQGAFHRHRRLVDISLRKVRDARKPRICCCETFNTGHSAGKKASKEAESASRRV
jgi:hypothetical protein